jgi:hypothetical protein
MSDPKNWRLRSPVSSAALALFLYSKYWGLQVRFRNLSLIRFSILKTVRRFGLLVKIIENKMNLHFFFWKKAEFAQLQYTILRLKWASWCYKMLLLWTQRVLALKKIQSLCSAYVWQKRARSWAQVSTRLFNLPVI